LNSNVVDNIDLHNNHKFYFLFASDYVCICNSYLYWMLQVHGIHGCSYTLWIRGSDWWRNGSQFSVGYFRVSWLLLWRPLQSFTEKCLSKNWKKIVYFFYLFVFNLVLQSKLNVLICKHLTIFHREDNANLKIIK